jgi:hypothetical protein
MKAPKNSITTIQPLTEISKRDREYVEDLIGQTLVNMGYHGVHSFDFWITARVHWIPDWAVNRY